MTFNEQKHEAIATAKHLVEILGEVCDESPETTAESKKFMRTILGNLKAIELRVLCILDKQDNPE